ncbi:MAG: hypothetical protein R3F59_23650 [Myxococcota bacterium]
MTTPAGSSGTWTTGSHSSPIGGGGPPVSTVDVSPVDVEDAVAVGAGGCGDGSVAVSEP